MIAAQYCGPIFVSFYKPFSKHILITVPQVEHSILANTSFITFEQIIKIIVHLVIFSTFIKIVILVHLVI